WAGMQDSRAYSQTITRVDTTLASVILDALPDAVVLLDGQRRVVAANLAATQLLGDGVHGRDLCMTLRHPDAQRALKDTVAGAAARGSADVVFEAPVRRNFHLQVMAVPPGEAHSVRAVVALHEVTDLKRAEDMRADFVANVSHELRSPLSTLTGFIETLQTAARDDVEARERFLGVMHGEAARMNRLIDDLLSLARIEVNEHIRPTGRVDLGEVVSDVLDSVSLNREHKGMALKISVPHDLPAITGDRDQVRQVVQNLVDNAIKYGPEHSEIAIAADLIVKHPETRGPGVEIHVSNQGEGIAPQHLARLTERFYRVDKGRSRAMGGTGLGLAIVKHIVNRHRGRLLVHSQPGQGARFTVQFPAWEG
ncbi:MAG: PAS domain-containing protein, partial [Alphaproteobacteria bacterium]|nr:PAS domain-containing protein [Alphaproteobacteria bacterium]